MQESVYDKFMPLLVDAFKKINIGDPLLRNTYMGAHVSKAHFERILSYIEKAKQGGATVAAGGVRHGNKGYFIEPTLFTDVSLENVAGREEIFGAVGASVLSRNPSHSSFEAGWLSRTDRWPWPGSCYRLRVQIHR